MKKVINGKEFNIEEFADLSGADLRVADLTGANLSQADLSDANLRRSNLTDANLSGADLTRANLTGADLTRANLSGAILPKVGKIKTMRLFDNLYTYQCGWIISEDNIPYIKMGCFTRTVQYWADDFWNNPKEFNGECFESKRRWAAYQFLFNDLENYTNNQ